jgi:hypothetical protein
VIPMKKVRPSAAGASPVRIRGNPAVEDLRPGQTGKAVYPGGGLRYSSPLPWIVAIVLSSALWAMLGWLIWRWLSR